MQVFTGIVRHVYEKPMMFDMIIKDKVEYFYLSRSLEKKFDNYLQEGNCVKVLVKDQKIIENILVWNVISFDKISKIVGKNEVIYYDSNEIKEGVKKLLKRDNYRLFIDFEFTMPPYNYKHGGNSKEIFQAELVQYGFCLEDAKGNLIDEAGGYIHPLYEMSYNERTLEFLGVSKDYLKNKAPYYSKFYNELKDYLTLYQPIIYIWGKNDYLMLSTSYEQHKVKPITERKNFVNLMQIMKNYYNIKDDIGLYAAYDLLNAKRPMQIQDHQALHDAQATMEIFHLFDQEINK